MAKYKIGDRFITTITEIDDSGMGTIYTLDHSLYANEIQLNEMELEVIEPNSEKNKPKEYTAEELKRRIFRLIEVLNGVSEEYKKVQGTLDFLIPNTDIEIENLSL